jgi:hypothetical protein
MINSTVLFFMGRRRGFKILWLHDIAHPSANILRVWIQYNCCDTQNPFVCHGWEEGVQNIAAMKYQASSPQTFYFGDSPYGCETFTAWAIFQLSFGCHHYR